MILTLLIIVTVFCLLLADRLLVVQAELRQLRRDIELAQCRQPSFLQRDGSGPELVP